MHRGSLAVVLLTAGLAGCIGSDAGDPVGSTSGETAAFPACEHPWPCGDGSAWPASLTADEHPRQPARMPSGLSIEEGQTLSANGSHVAYRFEGTLDQPTLPVAEQTTTSHETTFDVPAGLYLDLLATMTWSGGDPAPPPRDAAFRLSVLDGAGDPVCEGSTGIGVGLVSYNAADERIRCIERGVQPLDEPARWTVRVESHHDLDAADRFQVDLALDVAEPVRTFPMLEPEHVQVDSFDGTTLDGWVYRPDVPDGVQVPVVLWSLPYLGQTGAFGDDPDVRTGRAVPIEVLVEHGYAVAAFNVRGTGLSEGCFGMFGPDEQRDQVELVRWLADREWSNDRVAMMGLSYHGTTPWEAAIQTPQALKTIVVAGMVSDLYSFYHTPQGAAFTSGGGFQALFNGLTTFAPPALGVTSGGPPERATTQWAPVAPDRVCPEVVETMTALWKGTATDDRHPAYWDERRLIDGFPNVTAAVLLTHGFEDRWGSGHQQQELAAWNALPASTPKHQLEGQWQHEFPDENSYNPAWALDDWDQRLLDWLAFWLKGQGQPPEALGTVEYQDGTGNWRTSQAWPPTQAREQVLHPTGQALWPAPSDGARTFRSVPDPAGSEAAYRGVDEGIPGPLCTREDPSKATPHGLLYATEPLDQGVLLAGNPFAYLRLTSSQPGGLVTATLFDLGPDFRCEGATPVDAHPLTTGAADLRFHEGNLRGKPFPTGKPTWVRVDLTNLAEVVPRDHQLAVLLSYGDPTVRTSQPYTPEITVHGDSELVLPVVEGTLGGNPPGHGYPPRPFVPPSS